MNEDGQERQWAQRPTQKEALLSFCAELGEPCQVVLEAGRNWELVYDWLEGQVAGIAVAHLTSVKGANKAKVAVARKLCELVWYVWKAQRPYEERTTQVALSPS